MNKIFKTTVFGIMALFALASCGRKSADTRDADRPVVMVTVPPLQYFADAIGGDKVDVKCLLPQSAEPESFDPTMQQLRDAADADVIFSTGLLPFESKVVKSVASSNPDIKVASLSDSLHLLMGTHGHNEADPHIWMSLRNARVMARTAARALISALPADSAYFAERFAATESRLDSLDSVIASRLAPAKGKAFLVWHPSLSYFARDYGLRQIAVGQEHKESSISGLTNLLKSARSENAVCFFSQKELDSRQAQMVDEALGLKPVDISTLSPEIESTLLQAADAIASASKLPQK